MMVSLAAVVIAGSAVLGQTQALPSNYEHLKHIEWIVGTWTTEGEIDETIPGIAEKGTKTEMKLVTEWILNKNAISVTLISKAKGAPDFVLKGMIGWDAASEQIVSGNFDSMGGHGYRAWHKVGNDWHAKGVGVDPFGKKTEDVLVFANITEKSFGGRTIERHRDGENLPDSPAGTWSREE